VHVPSSLAEPTCGGFEGDHHGERGPVLEFHDRDGRQDAFHPRPIRKDIGRAREGCDVEGHGLRLGHVSYIGVEPAEERVECDG
jgi:hypothetical protein